MATAEVSEWLHITFHTVRNDFKVVFDKLSVRSWRELVDQVFVQQCQPRMATCYELDADG
ncbi:MAG: hypothetical protein JOZ19_14515 [Rubrobacter sp.]|nr:hypothetical protein [Rubrobacter sp.]